VSSAAEKSAVTPLMRNLPITAVILSEVEGPAVAFAVAVAFLAVIPEGDLLLSVPFSCPFILLVTLTPEPY
jgi:hypothetical protein